ncbi:MAG: hypothetical protein HN838_00595 [Rhodospirillaceae bacterium]|nr:hypothetical protein [Rhodospirillaceae bacterium]
MIFRSNRSTGDPPLTPLNSRQPAFNHRCVQSCFGRTIGESTPGTGKTIKKKMPMQSSVNRPQLFEGRDSGFHLTQALQDRTAPSGGKYAIYLSLSSLDQKNLHGYHLSTIKYAIETICQNLGAKLFLFENTDMIVLCSDTEATAIENITHRLRGLFTGMITLLQGNKTDSLCNWYDLITQGDQFEEVCRPLTENSGTITAHAAPPSTSQKTIEPINADMLAKLERGLATIDVSSFIRRQPICKILPGIDTHPKHLANEIYVRVNDLRDTILPEVDLMANRWLFRHLTAQLDQRVLATILENIQANLRTPISLNMNIKSVMSHEFTQLVRLLSPSQREKIIIEIHCVDLISDPGAFQFAHAYLSNIGFELALDGTDIFSFPEFARHDVGFHYVKFGWDEALEGELTLSDLQRLDKAVRQLGSEKVILCHCGTARAMEFGHQVGVYNFQGRHIDELLNPSLRRQN